MVIKQMDALEFVQSLEGGWDCIVWDQLEAMKEFFYHLKDTFNDNKIREKTIRAKCLIDDITDKVNIEVFFKSLFSYL